MLASRTAHDCIEATDGSPERAARAHTLALARVVADAHRFAPLTTTFLSAPAPLSLDRLQHVSFLKRHHSSPYAPTFLGFSQIRLQHVSFLIGDLAGNAWIFFVALFLKVGTLFLPRIWTRLPMLPSRPRFCAWKRPLSFRHGGTFRRPAEFSEDQRARTQCHTQSAYQLG
mmetsp:Transcript_39723/g.105895  ORF Transcript_39723/g.105895 Transcript_39723/m.105895 type:complete len:171 (+) Transcript_39723:486-998(+)